MAGMTGAFADALDRKYANLESNTAGENRLRDAQATDITAQTGANIGLKNAQANLQNANASTTKPLADASIAATQSQIGLQQGQLYGAQSGLYGAQTQQINEGFSPAALDVLGNYAAERGARPDAPLHFADGTANVQPKMDMMAPQMGSAPSMDMARFHAMLYEPNGRGPTGALLPAQSRSAGVMSPEAALQSQEPTWGDLAASLTGQRVPARGRSAGVYPGNMAAMGGATEAPGAIARFFGSDYHPAPPPHFVQGYSTGTSNVPPTGAHMAAPLPPPGVAPVQPMGQPMVTPLLDHMHGIVHHAMSALHASMSEPNVAHYAGGGSVPGPGQTQGGGSWEGPQPTTGTPMGTPTSSTPNQDLRAKMFPVKAAGGMSNVPSPGQTITSGSWEGPQPTTSTPSPAMGAPSPTPNADLRAKMGYGVKAANGLSKVPGKGNPGVDKVPAVLAPGEAVLNAGAANHMGRGAIAALNALGAHAMAAQGTPPMQTPPGGGAPQPMGGPSPKVAKPAGPPQGKTVAPMARGMPPAKSKAPPAKGKAPPPKMAAKK